MRNGARPPYCRYSGRMSGGLAKRFGPLPEPRGMLAHPRMVGRALEGDVQRDLDTVFVRRGEEVVEVGDGAELRVDGGVSALGGADAPRTAGVVRAGGQRVVRPLAEA